MVLPDPFGEAVGFCLPCWVYQFLPASVHFLLVSFCCSLPLTWVTFSRSSSGLSLPLCGSLRGVPLYGREHLHPGAPLPPSASSTASTALCLQEHHLPLKGAACVFTFQRWLFLALDFSWPPSTPVMYSATKPLPFTPKAQGPSACSGDLHAAHLISFRISILTGKASES